MTSDLRDSIEEVCMDHIQWAARRSFSEMEQEIVDKLVDLFEAELAQAVQRIEDIIENHRDCEPAGCASMILAELDQLEEEK